MDRFGASVEARYLQLLGIDAEVPEDGYHGDYVIDLAEDILEDARRAWPTCPSAERLARIRQEGADAALRRRSDRSSGSGSGSTATCTSGSSRRRARSTPRSSGSARGAAYEAEGAIWFRSTEYGDDKDRPLVRSNGLHTHFGADAAYLIDKFERGFEHLVYVWGADHHGTSPGSAAPRRRSATTPSAWRSSSTSGCRSCAAASRS